MKQSTNIQHRQAQWRERLVAAAQSGQSLKAFCWSEGIAMTQTFLYQ